MARIGEPTKKQITGWRHWVASRPPCIRVVAERFDPWSLYRMRSTGQRVTVQSFSEDGTITVAVTGQFNAVLFDRDVFGVDPDDLEPCELPDADEVLGCALSGEGVAENIDALRVAIRPDLFVMDANGKAKRKQ